MSRKLLTVILGISLLCNALVGLLYYRALGERRPAEREGVDALRVANGAPIANSAIPAANSPAATPSPDSDTKVLFESLRKVGASQHLLWIVAQQLVVERQRAERDRIYYGTGPRQKWQYGVASKQLTAAQKAALLELDMQQEKEILALLGPDYEQKRLEEGYFNNPKYSMLSREKIEALVQLQKDQAAAARSIARESGAAGLAMMQKFRQAENDEIAKLLTPEEFAAYRMYNSQEAANLQRGLMGAEVSDQQYEAIFNEISKLPAGSAGAKLSWEINAISTHASPGAALKYAEAYDITFGPALSILSRAGLDEGEILRRRNLFADLYTSRGTLENALLARTQLMEGLSPALLAELAKTQVHRELDKMTKVPPPKN